MTACRRFSSIHSYRGSSYSRWPVRFFIVVKRLGNLIVAVNIIGAFAMFIYVVHIFIATYFKPANLLFEVFDIVLITTCLFILPNRWVINLSVSLGLVLLFFLTVPLTIPAIEIGIRIITTVYLFWNTVVLSIIMYRLNMHKRMHFAQKTQLEALVNIDYLTKTHNRTSCDILLEAMCRDGAEFSIAIFDIDDFKKINDSYGHLTGDNVLLDIVDAVRKVIRKDDIIARWGGEEFLIIMPNTSLPEATESAQRLLGRIASIERAKVREIITCSFGVTRFAAGDSKASIINRADQLLYIAKEYGKNRVVAG